MRWSGPTNPESQEPPGHAGSSAAHSTLHATKMRLLPGGVNSVDRLVIDQQEVYVRPVLESWRSLICLMSKSVMQTSIPESTAIQLIVEDTGISPAMSRFIFVDQVIDFLLFVFLAVTHGHRLRPLSSCPSVPGPLSGCT